MPATDLQQRTVRFVGRVQGVGFRYSTRQIAQRYPVTGFVRNEPDGSVLLLAEGPAGAIDSLIDDVRTKFDGLIQHEQPSAAPATSEYAGFEIQRS